MTALRVYTHIPRCVFLGYVNGQLVCRKNSACDCPCNVNLSTYTNPPGHWMSGQTTPAPETDD